MGWGLKDAVRAVAPASALFDKKNTSAPKSFGDMYKNPLAYYVGQGQMWGTLAAAGASGGFNYWSQKETNKQNRQLSREQMEFQERMSSTAHQREVEDLRRAGLNPTLSAGGNGSSTPSGAAATMQAPLIDLQPIFSAIQLQQDQQRIDIQKDVAGVGIGKTKQDTALAKEKTNLAKKGQVRATVESEINDFLRSMIDKYKNRYQPSKTPNKLKREQPTQRRP